MAIAFVGVAGNANSGASTCVVSTGASSVGDLITVQIEWGAVPGDVGVTVTGVTDNGGNTYHQAPGAFVSSAGFFRHTDIWYANVTGSATSVTVQFSANQSFGGTTVAEWSGARTSSPLQTAGNVDQEGSSAPIGPSLTPSVAGTLSIAVCNSNATGESSVDAPWTASNPGGGDALGYYINAPLSAQVCNFQPNTSQPFVSSGAIFLPPATGPSAKQKASMNLVF